MMESINEFIKNLRERLASPFFFSFIVAWIFFNWKVTVALIWYNPDLYPNNGDLINYIECKTSNWQSIGLPLISAALYTGLLRNLLSAFIEFSAKWGGNWNLDISKGSKIPMKKFLVYRDLYLKSTTQLEKIIQDEKKTIEEFETQRQKINELETENLSSKGEIEILKNSKSELQRTLNMATETSAKLQLEYDNLISSVNDQKFIAGTWEFKYENPLLQLSFAETLFIRDEVIYNVKYGKTEGIYVIQSYFLDRGNDRLLMILKYIHGSAEKHYLDNHKSQTETFKATNEIERRAYLRTKYEQIFVHTLEIHDEGNLLTGNENDSGKISYKRSLQANRTF